MPRVILTGSAQQRAGGVGSVVVEADTAAAAVRALEAAYPELKGWVVDEQGAVRRHVRLFLRGGAVPLEAALGPEDELHIVASISGG
jgi:molybdopterin converting factor small subunit